MNKDYKNVKAQKLRPLAENSAQIKCNFRILKNRMSKIFWHLAI